MIDINLALIGYGNVAQGLTRILIEREAEFARKYGLRFCIVAICDPLKGNAFDAEALDKNALLAAAQLPGGLKNLPGEHPTWDAMEMIQNSPADVVIEMSYTNLQTGEPSTSYISEALMRKKHVITTNKGPIALHYNELSALAHVHEVQIGVEGTVMSGTPVLRVGRELLGSAGVRRIQGIFNGTTNFILTRMESGSTYADALAEAQALGYAEADPSGDVEGFDAAAKVAILARVVMGTAIPFSEVEREGITHITPEQIAQARRDNQRWKLVGTLEKTVEGVQARVRPECLPDDHPLASISGATNAIVYTTDYLGDVTMIGPGAGREATGYAIIQDLLWICAE